MILELANIHLLDAAPGFVDIERQLVQFQPSADQQEHDDLVMPLAMAVRQAAKDDPALLRAAG